MALIPSSGRCQILCFGLLTVMLPVWYQVPQSGTLKLSHLREGAYTFQLTVMDTAGQRSSDNVSVTVLPVAFSTGGCSSVCSRYHFFCDDGCCIDIMLACDGVEQCPDGSDEAFCQNLSDNRKMVTHRTTARPKTTGPSTDAGRSASLEKSEKATTPEQPPELSTTEKSNHSTFWGPESRIDLEMPDGGSSGKNRKEENYIFESKSNRGGGEHPAPEADIKYLDAAWSADLLDIAVPGYLNKKSLLDFTGGPVAENLPTNAGDASSIPDLGDSTCCGTIKPVCHHERSCHKAKPALRDQRVTASAHSNRDSVLQPKNKLKKKEEPSPADRHREWGSLLASMARCVQRPLVLIAGACPNCYIPECHSQSYEQNTQFIYLTHF
uniref:LDL receptor related protein 11 n=1 Tax=Bos mutus grunniens TaxID=30521 RepID=A0A8B9XX75_BOSMU